MLHWARKKGCCFPRELGSGAWWPQPRLPGLFPRQASQERLGHTTSRPPCSSQGQDARLTTDFLSSFRELPRMQDSS